MLVDTSGWLCLIHKDETQHREAARIYDAGSIYLTTDLILAELVALARVRGFPRNKTIAFSRRILDDPTITVVWTGEDICRRSIDLLEARADKTYSLCDAASFVIMRDHNLKDALTTDRHFEQEGFNKLL